MSSIRLDTRPCGSFMETITLDQLELTENMLPPWLGGGISDSNPDDATPVENPIPMLSIDTKSIFLTLSFFF